MTTEPSAELVAAIDTMDCCVIALALELPSAVWEDVQAKWEAVRALLIDGTVSAPPIDFAGSEWDEESH